MSTDFAGSLCYLDHAAATPLLPAVADAMQEAAGAFGNPSSMHAAGSQARRRLEEAREQIVATLGGRTTGQSRDRLLFTSGATEANQMAVAGLMPLDRSKVPLFHSARDHAATREAARGLAADGRVVKELPLNADGALDTTAVAHAAANTPQAVVSTTLACSQTGTLQNLATISATFPQAILHVDAVQAVGRVPLCFSQLPVASLALAAHKLGGPRGIGGLLLRDGVAIRPLLPGSQERGLRGGTESVALAVGFATAVELAVRHQAAETARLAELRDRFEHILRADAAAKGLEVVVIGEGTVRVPHISVIAFPGFDRQATVMAADLAGICLASGTACSSGSSEPSPALLAAGIPQSLVNSAVRISLGWTTTNNDLDRVLAFVRANLFCHPW
jgi:cysteine desulfurase